jgi:hypothetical protein
MSIVVGFTVVHATTLYSLERSARSILWNGTGDL